MDDTDIRGLSAQDARAYALEFLTALKGLERDLAALGDEISTWAKRVELAASKGAAELEAAARAKLDELGAKRAGLEAERADIAAKVARIRERLPMAGASERSVDPDLLLAQLRMAAGQDPDESEGDGSAKLDSDLAALGADDALAALKRKLGEGKNA
ncbi:MAG: chromosome partitioning protein [Spirochaetes bacterium]|nr:chromosome partitioning protein [Spirochaetota bacterium]MBU1081824.1 chromosome partitioning protein [Spirochaetota bacterium]